MGTLREIYLSVVTSNLIKKVLTYQASKAQTLVMRYIIN